MQSPVLCIVGLGYVGLPLAHAFAEAGYRVIGFDVDAMRIEELQSGHDRTGELSSDQLAAVSMEFHSTPDVIAEADIVIVALPTPVDDQKKPDLSILERGSATVGAHLKRGAIVVYESTVYPGVTEEICGPILARQSGMECGTDFTLGYSPERINPGDKEHTVRSIVKIVAGQDEKTADTLCTLYGSIVQAGIHRAPCIKVAEMAKAIENAQRDINIAYVNEIAMLCSRLGLRTKDVLHAAGTKWNFLRFQPGLVGGHCIGVDPYYLVEKASNLGMNTALITAGRSVNDGMAAEVASQVCTALGEAANGANVLLLGVTFKEDVPDLRNSKVRDVARHLQGSGMVVHAHDPMLDTMQLEQAGYSAGDIRSAMYDAVLLLVPHAAYRNNPALVLEAGKKGALIYDLKNVLDEESVRRYGMRYLSL